jgi:hypothetical protein
LCASTTHRKKTSTSTRFPIRFLFKRGSSEGPAHHKSVGEVFAVDAPRRGDG